MECWGANNRGQLGVGLPDVVDRLWAGFSHACALVNNGEVWCWGANDVGQLGDGTLDDKTSAGPSGL